MNFWTLVSRRKLHMSEEEKLTAIETRVHTIETYLEEVKDYIHKAKNEAMKTVRRLTVVEANLKTVKDNTVEIISLVDGGKKIFGFAKKHWKTALTFGAGLMTALGIGNPELTKFFYTFFR